ncbi:MAG: ATP-binding protein [Nitrospinota bacterium]
MKIGTRLSLYLVTTLIVVMTAHALFNLRESEKSILKEIRAAAERQARITADGALRAITGGHPGPLMMQLMHLGGLLSRLQGVREITVFGPEKEPLLSAGREDRKDLREDEALRKLFQGGEPEGYVEQGDGGRLYDFFYPLRREDGRTVGAVKVVMDMATIESHKAQARLYNILTIAGITAFLAFMFYFFTRRNLSQPLEQLQRGVQRFSQGDLEHRIRLEETDEIGHLAQTFNQMAEEIQRTHRGIMREREFTRSIIESISDGIIVIDKDKRVTAWNRATARLCAISGEEEAGRPLGEVFPQCMEGSFSAELEALLGGKRASFTTTQTKELSPGGERLLLNIDGYPLRDASGEITGVVLVIKDVTDRVKLERQVQRTEKMAAAGQLVSGIAHEVGTPLNIISGRAEWVMKRLEPESPLREKLSVIIQQIDRIARLVRQCLAFARQKQLTMRPEGVNRILESVAELLEPQIERQGLTLRMELAGDLPSVTADADQLQQLFLNLCLNAIQVMPREGELVLSSALADGRGPASAGDAGAERYIRVDVSDTGPGIPEEHLNKIFDPFFTTKDVGEGTGLGLTVSSRIAEAHRGWIEVRSEVGKGSVFSVFLPAAE